MAGIQYDYIVVGAGLTGALTARRLADRGNTVVVLEATKTLGGTVSLGPGLALQGTPELYTDLLSKHGESNAVAIWQLTADNLTFLEQTLQAQGQTGLETGCLRTSMDSEQAGALQQSVNELVNAGYEVSAQDTPWPDYGMALYTGTDIVFNPYKLVPVLLDHPNIIVELNAEVHRIRADEGSVTVSAHKRYLQAREVILCNGIHARSLNKQLASIVHPRILYTFDVENAPSLSTPMVMYDGHITIIPNETSWRVCSWSKDENSAQAALVSVAEQICPEAVVVQRHTHWIAQTEDGLPVVGTLNDEQNIHTITGLGAYGLSWAFVAVEQLIAYLDSPAQTPHNVVNINRFAG